MTGGAVDRQHGVAHGNIRSVRLVAVFDAQHAVVVVLMVVLPFFFPRVWGVTASLLPQLSEK